MFGLYIESIGKLQQRYSYLKGGVSQGLGAKTANEWSLIKNLHIVFGNGQLPAINENLVKISTQVAEARLPAQASRISNPQQPTYRQ